MARPIAISLSPNTTKQDVFLALQLLLSPWRYFRGSGVKQLEQWFRTFFDMSYAVSFASGRAALTAILSSYDIGKDDEVLLQAFTCVAVPNAVLSVGARPIYVDIAKDLTLDPDDVAKKITAKTKAIIVQHTFGIPSDMTRIRQLAKKHKCIVIEDCAHVVGGTYKQKKLGCWSDAAIFSFGRDKAFSSVFGGMAITNNQVLGKKLKQFQKKQENPSFLWVTQQLFHPVALAFVLPLYTVASLGKILLVALQKLHFLSFPVMASEKKGTVAAQTLKRLPNALALLALSQLKTVKQTNTKREQFVTYYQQQVHSGEQPFQEEAPLLRFPLLVDNRDRLLQFFKKQGIYLGTWYSAVIDPLGVDFKKVYYKKGSCPNAEFAASRIINLPTYPTLTNAQAKKVCQVIRTYYDHYSRNNK